MEKRNTSKIDDSDDYIGRLWKTRALREETERQAAEAREETRLSALTPEQRAQEQHRAAERYFKDKGE